MQLFVCKSLDTDSLFEENNFLISSLKNQQLYSLDMSLMNQLNDEHIEMLISIYKKHYDNNLKHNVPNKHTFDLSTVSVHSLEYSSDNNDKDKNNEGDNNNDNKEKNELRYNFTEFSIDRCYNVSKNFDEYVHHHFHIPKSKRSNRWFKKQNHFINTKKYSIFKTNSHTHAHHIVQ